MAHRLSSWSTVDATQGSATPKKGMGNGYADGGVRDDSRPVTRHESRWSSFGGVDMSVAGGVTCW